LWTRFSWYLKGSIEKIYRFTNATLLTNWSFSQGNLCLMLLKKKPLSRKKEGNKVCFLFVLGTY
jgi:hypothetical protein